MAEKEDDCMEETGQKRPAKSEENQGSTAGQKFREKSFPGRSRPQCRMLQGGLADSNGAVFGFCNRDTKEVMARAVSTGDQMAEVWGEETGAEELAAAWQEQPTLTHCQAYSCPLFQQLFSTIL